MTDDMDLEDYESWKFPFGKWKGKTIPEIPSSYLDWLIGEDWFVSRSGNRDWVKAIGKELLARKRSHYEPKAGQDEAWERREFKNEDEDE